MTITQLLKNTDLTPLVLADGSREISGVFCCDLLSVVMSKAFEDCAWITVMGNINSVAVASLDDMACIVLADGCAVDEVMLIKAKEQEINVLLSKEPIFETADTIHRLLK